LLLNLHTIFSHLCTAYTYVGCFKDSEYRAIRNYFGSVSGGDSIQKCYEKVLAKGYYAFGIQNGGECWSSVAADSKYNMYGPADNCKDGKGQTN